MKVKLIKQWGDNKKGDELEIVDLAVLKAGFEAELFDKSGEKEFSGLVSADEKKKAEEAAKKKEPMPEAVKATQTPKE